LAGKIAVDGFGKQVSELSEEDKQTVSALATLASGLAGGLVGDSSANAVAAAQAGKTTVENNSLSEAADYLATGKKPEDRYKDAQQQLKDAVDEFKAKNCDGLSAAACGAKMDAHRDELLAGFAEAGSDYIPVYGDIKSFQEADSALGYLAAVVGILPGLGDEAGALLKGVDKALKAGDLETASKLINKASNEIEAVARPSHRQSELDVGKDLGDGWREQVSFKDGKEVPYGTKGGVRPDWCQGNVCSVEVKNYNITTNKNGLINNVAKQAVERQKNLPAGMRQEVVIDIRGQKVTSIQEDAIIKGIVQKTNGAIKPTDIQFKR
ncbi:VENN motif pre-toxin domain-containing protein, partial [Enterobacter quasiroggenkampii]